MPIETNQFIDEVVAQGYTHLCVVPCSFAINIINASINNSDIEYLPCASEAIACSVAAGLKMAKKNPIVVAQSSGLANMGSCITSFLKPYNINFPIIISWRLYKIGDSELQHQHLATKLPNLILAYGYDYCILKQDCITNIISQINQSNDNHEICILMPNTFSKVELDVNHKVDLSKFPPRSKYLKLLNQNYKNYEVLFIGTTGNTAREMYHFMPDVNNFYMAGNMGGALSVGLGASLVEKNVIVCGGDAEFVMHMGGLTTTGRYSDKINLIYILFDNESNKSTGGQNTYQRHINYINLAKNSNFNTVDKTIYTTSSFLEVINDLKHFKGLTFIHVKCSFDDDVERPPLEVINVSEFKNDQWSSV